MQFTKNTSSGKLNLLSIVIKAVIILVIVLGIFFLISTIDFPAPKNSIEKIIPNENFKIVK
tara:strand:+ start:2252 stop:2434 length:183 start_codon:yes stop_codon:yes gene_type:complete